METEKNFTERRKDKRFKVKDPVFAILNNSSKMGRIVDISKSGLALRYCENGADYAELNKIDVFKSDFSIYINDIKANIISDFQVIGKMFFGSRDVRQCGVRFEKLSSKQIAQLESLINTATA